MRLIETGGPLSKNRNDANKMRRIKIAKMQIKQDTESMLLFLIGELAMVSSIFC